MYYPPRETIKIEGPKLLKNNIFDTTNKRTLRYKYVIFKLIHNRIEEKLGCSRGIKTNRSLIAKPFETQIESDTNNQIKKELMYAAKPKHINC